MRGGDRLRRGAALLIAAALIAAAGAGLSACAAPQPARRYEFDADRYAMQDIIPPERMTVFHDERRCFTAEGQPIAGTALVRATVQTPRRVQLTAADAQSRYPYRVDKPLKINAVCHAAADVPVAVGDVIHLSAGCRYDAAAAVITEYYTEDAPLVEGYDYFVYLRYTARNDTYTAFACYPLCPYDALPYCTSLPASYGRETRQWLLYVYGTEDFSAPQVVLDRPLWKLCADTNLAERMGLNAERGRPLSPEDLSSVRIPAVGADGCLVRAVVSVPERVCLRRVATADAPYGMPEHYGYRTDKTLTVTQVCQAGDGVSVAVGDALKVPVYCAPPQGGTVREYYLPSGAPLIDGLAYFVLLARGADGAYTVDAAYPVESYTANLGLGYALPECQQIQRLLRERYG